MRVRIGFGLGVDMDVARLFAPTNTKIKDSFVRSHALDYQPCLKRISFANGPCFFSRVEGNSRLCQIVTVFMKFYCKDDR